MENKLKFNAEKKISYICKKLREHNIVAEQILFNLDKTKLNEDLQDSLNQDLADCMENIKTYESILKTMNKYYAIACKYPDDMEANEIIKKSATDPEILICYYPDRVFFNEDIAFIMNDKVDTNKFGF